MFCKCKYDKSPFKKSLAILKDASQRKSIKAMLTQASTISYSINTELLVKTSVSRIQK